MLNFYKFYNKNGLDNDHYELLISELKSDSYHNYNFTPIEHIIKKDPERAYWYTKNIMKKRRWIDAEPYIMKDPAYAYFYAADVMHSRWKAAEPFILKKPVICLLLCKRCHTRKMAGSGVKYDG